MMLQQQVVDFSVGDYNLSQSEKLKAKKEKFIQRVSNGQSSPSVQVMNKTPNENLQIENILSILHYQLVNEEKQIPEAPIPKMERQSLSFKLKKEQNLG